MKHPDKIRRFLPFVCVLIRLLTGIMGLNAQTMEMEIELPSLFSLQPLPELNREPAKEEEAGKKDMPAHWLEITGDENIGIMVYIRQRNDTVRACYINTGQFHTGDAIPFKNNRAFFILNRTAGTVKNRPFFKAWIGFCADDVTRLTIDYL
jgi:hypothetical protein